MNRTVRRLINSNFYVRSDGQIVTNIKDVEHFTHHVVQACISVIAVKGVSEFEDELVATTCSEIIKDIKRRFET